MLQAGLIGLAQAGKTTLFEIMTRAHGGALTGGRPEAHVGVVTVPDSRLEKLAEMFQPRRTIHASVEYVDTPGSVIDLLRAGRESQAMRELHALVHVVAAFGDDASPQSLRRNVENLELELLLSDLAVAEKRLERLEKEVKKQKNAALELELQTLEACKEALEKQTPLREVPLSVEQGRSIRGFTFLSLKPMLYVFNLPERDSSATDRAAQLASAAGLKPRPQTAVTAVCGKVEFELSELSEREAAEFRTSYGLKDSALARVIRSTYQLLGMISFFTVGEDECRAWTIRSGATAWEAAGEIHSDIQKGFIRAEVITYDDLVACGNLAEARHRGRLRLEGKDYVVADGEIVHYRHSG